MDVAELRARARAALASGEAPRRLRDFVVAGALYRLPVRWRRALFAGDAHFCPVCDSRVRAFLPLHRAYNRTCPVCRSLQRHRFVWPLLDQLTGRPESGLRLLHVAPESGLRARLQARVGRGYTGTDLHAVCGGSPVDARADLTALPFACAAFDAVYCSHVLEHVPDDRAAMRELARVLRPGGWALIVVPVTAPATVEDASLADPVEQERRFGQLDHVRRYGPDALDRLAAAGFACTTLRAADVLVPGDVQRFGLNGSEEAYLCRPRPQSDLPNRSA